MAGNAALGKAKDARNDEFYTQLPDIENELRYYRKHFRGKSVLCNCDDPFESKFFEYFVQNFDKLGLERLVATCYAGSPVAGQQLSLLDVVPDAVPGTPYKAVVTKVYDATEDGYIDMHDVRELFVSGENELVELEGDGDFRSRECMELVDQCDIVVTNPPFSLFREYVTMLVEHGKQFVIIGPKNGVKYKETFPLIKAGKLWLGHNKGNGTMYFSVPGSDELQSTASYWFTNIDIKKRHEPFIMVKRYSPEAYLHYTNFDGIDVPNTSDIPCDWPGNMGVPISFLGSYNPDQFEIVGLGEGNLAKEAGIGRNQRGRTDLEVQDPDGTYRRPYARIIIRNLHPEPPKGQQA